MADEMTLDKALLKIVELEETINNQSVTLENLKNDKIKAEKQIGELQNSNMELFLKLSNKNENNSSSKNDFVEDDEIDKMDKLLKEWSV